jgi:hypothetical protein
VIQVQECLFRSSKSQIQPGVPEKKKIMIKDRDGKDEERESKKKRVGKVNLEKGRKMTMRCHPTPIRVTQPQRI